MSKYLNLLRFVRNKLGGHNEELIEFIKSEESHIGFGDYISVEQKRFGCENEFYQHKVVGTFKSNSWIDVPAITHYGATLHDTMEDVVSCICCGVSEDKVIRYKLSDVKLIKHIL